MEIRKIAINTINNYLELYKALSFACLEINDLKLAENEIHIYFSENINSEEANRKIDNIINEFKKNDMPIADAIEYKTNIPGKTDYVDFKAMTTAGLITDFKNGFIGLNNEAIKLFAFFNNNFQQIAQRLGAVEKQYPVLLPIDILTKTGYISSSPQYALFCCHPFEDIDILKSLNRYAQNKQLLQKCREPEYSLSPAACFHSYLEYKNRILDNPLVLTFTQRVFRNEGRFNWTDFGRLMDYTVREIVFFGNEEFVTEKRKQVTTETLKFIEKIGIAGKLCIAHDPFVIPAMQKFKKIQTIEKSKYELQLSYSRTKYLAAASFNLHGTAFCDPFAISIREYPNIVSGCVGFGLERWILAFLAQFGVNSKLWPDIIQSEIYKEN